MGCTCSRCEKAVAADLPTKKPTVFSAPQSPTSSAKGSVRPLFESFHGGGGGAGEKSFSTMGGLGDSFANVNHMAQLQADAVTTEREKSKFKKTAVLEDSSKNPESKANSESVLSVEAKEVIMSPKSRRIAKLDENSVRDTGPKAESMYSRSSKPSIFLTPSLASEKNTIKLGTTGEPYYQPYPRSSSDFSSLGGFLSWRANESLRGMPSLFDAQRRESGLVPSCGMLSPRNFLRVVPEESTIPTEIQVSTRNLKDGSSPKSHVENDSPKTKQEGFDILSKPEFKRHDSVEMKHWETDPNKIAARKNGSISGKGYRIEITDLSEEPNNNNNNNTRNNLHIQITDTDTYLDPKSSIKGPLKTKIGSPTAGLKSYEFQSYNPSTLSIPNISVSFSQASIMEEDGIEESNYSILLEPKEIKKINIPKLEVIVPQPDLPIINITKEENFQTQIKSKFRTNLLEIVLPKTPKISIHERETNDTRKTSDGYREPPNTPVETHTTLALTTSNQEKTDSGDNLLRVESIKDRSSLESKKNKLIPKPLELHKIEFFNGPDIISPIYNPLYGGNSTPPLDMHINSTFLKPMTITIDNLASIDDRSIYNGEDNISRLDLGGSFVDEVKEFEKSPTNLHPHHPIKQSVFGSKKVAFNKSKSVNFDEEANAAQQNQHRPQHKANHNELAPKNSNTLLSPFYDNRSHNDTMPSLIEVPSLSQLSVQQKRQMFAKHRPKSQVIQTDKVDISVSEDGQKKINQFLMGKELGRGTFGKVKTAIHSDTQRQFAIKIINKNKLKKKVFAKGKSAYSQIETEIAIMKKMEHPNIVNLLEVIDDADRAKLYLVMEIIEKGAVMSEHYFSKETSGIVEKEVETPAGFINLKCLSEEKARKYFRDLIQGLDYLHNYANIVHRDIKPENLLISRNDRLKISDFNIAHMIEEDNDVIKSKGGTRIFLAPEAWTNNTFRGRPLDIWAAGATLYYFLYGTAPFMTSNPTELKRRILEDEPEFPVSAAISEKAIALIKSCLNKDSEKRAKLEDIMNDPWVTKDGKETLDNEQYDTIEVNVVDIRQALTTKLHATIFVAAGLVRSLNSARKTLTSMQLDDD